MRTGVIVIMSLFWGLSAAYAAEEAPASLKSLSGQVTVERGTRIVPAVAGADLLQGDIVKTGSNAAAGISFLDGTRVSLGPASEIEITSYRFEPQQQDYSFDVYMKKGSAVYSSGKLGKISPDSIRFRTPQATVGVRGTKFLVKVN